MQINERHEENGALECLQLIFLVTMLLEHVKRKIHIIEESEISVTLEVFWFGDCFINFVRKKRDFIPHSQVDRVEEAVNENSVHGRRTTVIRSDGMEEDCSSQHMKGAGAEVERTGWGCECDEGAIEVAIERSGELDPVFRSAENEEGRQVRIPFCNQQSE